MKFSCVVDLPCHSGPQLATVEAKTEEEAELKIRNFVKRELERNEVELTPILSRLHTPYLLQ